MIEKYLTYFINEIVGVHLFWVGIIFLFFYILNKKYWNYFK